jgi:cytochrome c oxidase assembly factor CtaG
MTETVAIALGSVATLVAVGRVRGRVLLALAAVLVGVVSLLGPLDLLAERGLSAHMLQHVLIGDLAPLLLVLSLRGADLGLLLPSRLSFVAPRADRLFRPLPAFVFWAAAMGAWHVPAMYDLALENDRVHALEHACFMVGGLLVWTQLLDPARRGRLLGWRRFGYAMALLMAAQALANALVLSYRPLYGAYAATQRPLGLSAVGDQDAAAIVMMVEQVLTVGTFAFLTARRLLARTPQPVAAAARHPLAA